MGRKIHKNIKIKYFNKLAFLVIDKYFFEVLILKPGILYNNSWKNPKGQRKEQIILPKNVPNKIINAVTKNGIFPLHKEFCIAPKGQDEIAPGQE